LASRNRPGSDVFAVGETCPLHSTNTNRSALAGELPIGSGTPGTGAFTTLTTTGDATFGDLHTADIIHVYGPLYSHFGTLTSANALFQTMDSPAGTYGAGTYTSAPDARGAAAFDTQVERSSGTHVAAGRSSVLLATRNSKVTSTGAFSAVLGGEGSVVTGQGSVAIAGISTSTASGANAVTIASSGATASGAYSICAGVGNTAGAYCETVFGHYATVVSTGISASAIDNDNRIFAVGYGTATGSRADALSILATGATTLGGAVTFTGTTLHSGESTFSSAIVARSDTYESDNCDIAANGARGLGLSLSTSTQKMALCAGDIGQAIVSATGVAFPTGVDATAAATWAYKQTVEASTAGSGAPNVLTVAESGKILTNEGSTAQNYHTLPTAAAGLTFTFVVQDADGLRIVADTGDTIRIAAGVSAAAGYIQNSTIGSTITLCAINATEWVALGAPAGTWTIDS